MKRVLLLNPPGKQNYGRDYFCSKITKTNYVEHPVDFVYLSGVLKREDIKLHILDAIVDHKTEEECTNEINQFNPDLVFFLSGWVSWLEDFHFLKALKKQKKETRFLGSGDLFLNKKVFYQNDWIDAVLYDFTNDDILNYIREDYDKTSNMLLRIGTQIIDKKLQKNKGSKNFKLPIPQHELFVKKKYSFPFAKSLPFLTVLTDFGCPFHCSFCVYSEIGYKVGDLQRVFEELDYIRSLGIKELFFKDQTFCINRKRAEDICNYIIKKKLGFSWTCFLRVTQANLNFLSLLKKAGCHTIIYGVETADQESLDKYQKQTSIAQIKEAMNHSKKVRIRSVCTFILGFPGEDKKSIENTIQFALELNPNYAAFNTYVPKTESMGFDNDLSKTHDQSGMAPKNAEGNGVLSGEEIRKLRKKAVRKFYLRPRYILEQLKFIHSFSEFSSQFKDFLFLLKTS